jgi:hypothetical protein
MVSALLLHLHARHPVQARDCVEVHYNQTIQREEIELVEWAGRGSAILQRDKAVLRRPLKKGGIGSPIRSALPMHNDREKGTPESPASRRKISAAGGLLTA